LIKRKKEVGWKRSISFVKKGKQYFLVEKYKKIRKFIDKGTSLCYNSYNEII